MKYDKIVEISKEGSRQNTETAIRAIEEMLREGEWITVAQLAKKQSYQKPFSIEIKMLEGCWRMQDIGNNVC